MKKNKVLSILTVIGVFCLLQLVSAQAAYSPRSARELRQSVPMASQLKATRRAHKSLNAPREQRQHIKVYPSPVASRQQQTKKSPQDPLLALSDHHATSGFADDDHSQGVFRGLNNFDLTSNLATGQQIRRAKDGLYFLPAQPSAGWPGWADTPSPLYPFPLYPSPLFDYLNPEDTADTNDGIWLIVDPEQDFGLFPISNHPESRPVPLPTSLLLLGSGLLCALIWKRRSKTID